MSWSCYVKGTKEAVVAYVEENIGNSARMYDAAGTPEATHEAQDCRDAIRAILGALEGMSTDPDGFAPNGYHASVEAYGSRYAGGLTLHASVSKEPK